MMEWSLFLITVPLTSCLSYLLPSFKYSQHWFLSEGNRSFSYADACFKSEFGTSCPLSIFSYFGCLLHLFIFKHPGVKWVGTFFPSVSWNIFSSKTYMDIISYLFHYILHDLNANLLFLGINLWPLICFMNLPSSSNRESSYLTNGGTLPKKHLTDVSLALYLLMNEMFISYCLNSAHRFQVYCLMGIVVAHGYLLLVHSCCSICIGDFLLFCMLNKSYFGGV